MKSLSNRNLLHNMFRLKKPCANCPFRVVGAIELRPGRVEGIIRDLIADDYSTFFCHKTAKGSFEDAGEEEEKYSANGGEAMCAGAAIYLEKADRPNVAMRIAQLFGLYDPERSKAQSGAVIDVDASLAYRGKRGSGKGEERG